MVYKTNRKVIDLGSSNVVTLPAPWVKANKLTKGLILACTYNENEVTYKVKKIGEE